MNQRNARIIMAFLFAASIFALATFGCGIIAFIYLFKSNIYNFCLYIVMALVARQLACICLDGMAHRLVICHDEDVASRVIVSNVFIEKHQIVEDKVREELKKREEASKSTAYEEEQNRNGWGKE